MVIKSPILPDSGFFPVGQHNGRFSKLHGSPSREPLREAVRPRWSPDRRFRQILPSSHRLPSPSCTALRAVSPCARLPVRVGHQNADFARFWLLPCWSTQRPFFRNLPCRRVWRQLCAGAQPFSHRRTSSAPPSPAPSGGLAVVQTNILTPRRKAVCPDPASFRLHRLPRCTALRAVSPCARLSVRVGHQITDFARPAGCVKRTPSRTAVRAPRHRLQRHRAVWL